MTTTTAVGWTLACPACRRQFDEQPNELARVEQARGEAARSVTCACGSSYEQRDGVWCMLTPDRAAHFARFLADYTAIRHAEGRGSDDAAYYERLPDTAPDDPLGWQWSMRARTYDCLVRRVLPTLGSEPSLRIVDVGAGVGWLSNRLTSLGHRPFAIDLSVDAIDGLGALHHVRADVPAAQAEFDRMPLADASADAVVFNASLHYSVDYAATLTEALRVLRPDGAIVVLDSPVYRHEHSGTQMVAERHRDFERRFGRRSDSIPSIEYLTNARIDALGNQLGIEWQRVYPWYGVRWATRPVVAKLKGRREPSRFVVLVGRRAAAPAGEL